MARHWPTLRSDLQGRVCQPRPRVTVLTSPILPFPGALQGPEGNEVCSPISVLERSSSGRPSAPAPPPRRRTPSVRQAAATPGRAAEHLQTCPPPSELGLCSVGCFPNAERSTETFFKMTWRTCSKEKKSQRPVKSTQEPTWEAETFPSVVATAGTSPATK